ncbi:hypothetical protein Sjap_017423 [Stephania japonica]|uniref:Mechanosensitive ion channel protein n=1 Tax=Stephania japonica TaxID=461633 RepID=A0AAP0I658_9MAGN
MDRPSRDPPREVVVKIDDNNNNNNNNSKIWRESSYDFWKDNSNNGANSGAAGNSNFNFQQQQQNVDDPPSRLIGEFLSKQQESGLVSLDMDLEMDELRHEGGGRAWNAQQSSANSSREVRVSFQQGTPPPPPHHRGGEISTDLRSGRQRCKDKESSDEDEDEDEDDDDDDRREQNEVLRCTSRAPSIRRSRLLSRVKTRSRLVDPPPQDQQQFSRKSIVKRSGQLRSGPFKSGFLGKSVGGGGDDEEEDPFAGEDYPDDYTKGKITLVIALELLCLVIILLAFVCSLTIPFLVEKTMWEMHLWKWELLVLVLICGRLLSDWGIRLAVFFLERNFLLRKKVLYFIYGVRTPVTNCIWLGLVLIAWHFMFDKKVQRQVKTEVLSYITKVLVCLLVGTLIWLVKILLVKVLASSFHMSTYFDRIQDSLFNQFVIETLSGPPLIELQSVLDEEDKVMAEVQKLQNAGINVPNDFRDTAFTTIKSGRIKGSQQLHMNSSRIGKSFRHPEVVSKRCGEGITVEHLYRLNPKNVSAWNMKRLMKMVRRGVVSTLDEKIGGATKEDESQMQIRSEYEAKRAAKRIFVNVARPRAKYLFIEDIMRFMTEEEAEKAMSLFEGAIETKKVSKAALKNWVVNSFRERRALALTLNDTKTAVRKLHNIVNVIVGIIIIVVWLLILGIAIQHILVIISSQLLLVVFIFGNTCKMVFEAIIFLFAMHPFDVGDRCEVDGVQMVVEEMNILNTVFLRYDNQKIFYPNNILATMPISNFYRSPDMGDAIDFCVHLSTPAEKIAIVRQRIVGFIESKKDHWYPKPLVVLRDVEDMNRLKMSVWFCHRMNHQDMGERWVRREQVVEEMIRIFKELGIEYRMLPLDVNVRNMPSISSTRFPSNWNTCNN